MDYRREYHIHADLEVAAGFDGWLSAHGFALDNFCQPRSSFEPKLHYTSKLRSGRQFQAAWSQAEAAAITFPYQEGYLEGEVAQIYTIPDAPFNDRDLQLPFIVTAFEDLPAGGFREDEIHIEFDRDRSHPELRKLFKVMGFRQAFYPYSDNSGTGELWTLQSTTRIIQLVIDPLLEFITSCGGMVRGEVDRETVAKYWLSENPPAMGPLAKTLSFAS